MMSIKARGEMAVRGYLTKLGMDIVAINHRTQHGTIPIVAYDGEVLVHVRIIVKQEGTLEQKPPVPATIKYYAKRMDEYKKAQNIDPAIRFDDVFVLVISKDQALLSHHRAAYRIEE